MSVSVDQYKRWQIIFRDMGLYNNLIDGDWGKGSRSAHQLAIQKGIVGENIFDLPVCFSNKVSAEYNAKVVDIATRLKLNQAGPDQLMACMGWESGETFSPSVRNGAGSHAVGPIQWMPFVALTYWYSNKQIKAMSDEDKKQKGLECCDKLAAMEAVEQLEYVYKYFAPYAGKIDRLSDTYMCILYPVAVGKPEDFVLFNKDKSPIAYRQNIGIDINKDGSCTKLEAATKVTEKLIRGFKLLK